MRARSSLPSGRTWISVLLLGVLAAPLALAQGSARDYVAKPENLVVPAARLEGLELRSLNFSRGGRVTAVAGVAAQPLVYYFGATGGGVWKTTDAGNNWRNVTDEALGVGSVGAIAVADSDPNVVYVGTGSACPRGNVSNGDGVYRSTDAGKTWKHVGLDRAGQIGRILVHPRDENLVYVAALGNVFGPNEERGMYRSRDGGATWAAVLQVSRYTGFVDLAMDRTNPRILYAAAWRAERKPWTMFSGSEDGGLWRTADGGDHWEKLAGGLPEGLVGRIGVAISPARPERVWALLEAEGDKGGLYRSDDAGKTWQRTCDDARLRQRPWYYTHIYADPQDENTVYALNTGVYKSLDGGKTFAQRIEVPHGDNHDLWINPGNPRNLINGNDGGANVSFDGGESWSWQMNQPTAEIYRVFVDEQWPYRVYGPQQDNSTISISSDGEVSWNSLPPDWYEVGGCESGHIAVDPRDPDIVYAGCYGGSISRVDRKTGDIREVLGYPQLALGQTPRDLAYRFQWNAPIRLSPHDPDVLYHLSQVVHRSTDQGQSWQVISPDLSTDNPEHQDTTGGPITRDSTGVEVYNTIFAFEESPHRQGELWAGSDDGRIHVSRDDGKSWQEVTPRSMPQGGTVNSIDISAASPDRVYVAVHRYRENDFRPYLFRTDDSGRSWKLLTDGENGIPATHFTRVVREDPEHPSLLYAGTEYGLYLSFDEGLHWQRLQNNLPVVPVTDLRVHRRDLVIATQGRAFWVLDDLSTLHQLAGEASTAERWLFSPRTAHRGHPAGAARIRFFLANVPEEPVKLELRRGEQVVRAFEWQPGQTAAGDAEAEDEDSGPRPPKLEVKQGWNTFTWNLRDEAPEAPEGVIHWGFAPGAAVVPGVYQVRLAIGEWSQTRELAVEAWPTLATTQTEYQDQYELGQRIAGRLERIYDAIEQARDLRQQIAGVTERLAKLGRQDEPLSSAAKALTEKLNGVERQLTQTQSKSRQDPLNFPPRIDNQYVELYAYVVGAEHRPPAAAAQRLADLEPELERILAELDTLVAGDVSAFNDLVEAADLPAIAIAPTAK